VTVAENPPHVPSARSLGARVTFARTVRRKLRGFIPRATEDRNILFVTLDGVVLGLTTAASAFLSVFVVRLGASAFWVSMLTSLPALIHLTLALPASRFIERRRQVVSLFAGTRILAHSAYFLTGLLPFFLVGPRAAQGIVVLWGFSAVLTSFSNLAFTLVMSRAVCRERRALLMSSRWTAMGVSKIVVVALAGQILARLPFPLNYQIVFMGSFSADLLAFYFISQVQNPDQEPPARTEGPSEPLLVRLKSLANEIMQCRPFIRFSLARNAFWLGIETVAPLIPIYWVKNLQASDAWVSYFNAAVTATTLLSYGFWVRMKRKRGNRFVLLAGVLGRSLYPLFVALTPSSPVMLVAAAFNGVTFASENLMFFDAFLDTIPKGREPRFVAMNQTIANTIAFLAPPLGAFLLPYLGIRPLFMLGSGVALTGFLLFWLGGVAKESQRTAEASGTAS